MGNRLSRYENSAVMSPVPLVYVLKHNRIIYIINKLMQTWDAFYIFKAAQLLSTRPMHFFSGPTQSGNTGRSILNVLLQPTN